MGVAYVKQYTHNYQQRKRLFRYAPISQAQEEKPPSKGLGGLSGFTLTINQGDARRTNERKNRRTNRAYQSSPECVNAYQQVSTVTMVTLVTVKSLTRICIFFIKFYARCCDVHRFCVFVCMFFTKLDRNL